EHQNRLGVFSFFIEDAHFNLVVKLLNDRFGIQTRGGCSCAGTYGHYLLHLDQITSTSIEDQISEGCLIERPGWVRMSIHPTITNSEINYVCDCIKEVADHIDDWAKDYKYDATKNEFIHKNNLQTEKNMVNIWFSE
ncbi:MAG: aminotransferase class V-fold PLP-dependent enzyme, partial [Lutibacter sp.]